MVFPSLTFSLLMIPFFSSKMIRLPSTILEKLSFGIAQFLVKALISTNLTFFVLQIFLRKSKFLFQTYSRLILSKILANIQGLITNLEVEKLLILKTSLIGSKKKLQRWNAELLSQASRTILISSVLQAMPLYTFSCFRVPDAMCKKLDAFTRAFWWGHEVGTRKLHLVNWEKIVNLRAEVVQV